MRGERECSTGSPITQATRVAPVIVMPGASAWKCWKSAYVLEKWWRRFGSPGIAT